MGVSWHSHSPPRAAVRGVVGLIAPELDFARLFDAVELDGRAENGGAAAAAPMRARLQGVLCYFGWHYVAFFYSAAERLWVSFDDSAVRPVGATWAEAQARIADGHLQPLLLFYERDDA